MITKKIAKILAPAAMGLLLSMGLNMTAYADTIHTAKRGETIYGIAYKYHVSADSILSWNPHTKNGIKKGMTIVIKDGKGPKTQAAAMAKPVEAQQPAKETAAQEPENDETPSFFDETPVKANRPTNTRVETPRPAKNTAAYPENIYIAQEGDSFTLISGKTGVSQDDLTSFNPFLEPQYLKAGTMVRLSDDAPFIDPAAEVVEEPQEEELAAEDDSYGNDEAFEGSLAIAPVDTNGNRNILVLLPFMAESESPTRQAKYYADFYRGFLMAAKELSTEPAQNIEIITLDTKNDLDQLRDQLKYNLSRDLAVIIAPEEEAQLQAIIQQAAPEGVYVLNAFNFKDSSYQDNSNVLQAHIDQTRMYETAVEALMLYYPDHIPVILNPANGKTEKDPFINLLRQRYADKDVEMRELNYEGTLTLEALQSFLADQGSEGNGFVFIPRTGAVNVFNRFAPALIELRKETAMPSNYAVFGYPDWTAYRGESQNMLHQLNALIYSRIYFNEEDARTKEFRQDFVEWYGEEPMEAVPNQSILGYDTGKFLIGALQEGPLAENLTSKKYKGIQSSFQFVPAGGDGGYVNNALYIIRFLPSGTCQFTVL